SLELHSGTKSEPRPLVTTTAEVVGRVVAGRLGTVTGESVADPGPGGLEGPGPRISSAVKEAVAAMVERAAALGADAVVGARAGRTRVGNALVVTASGTAVRLFEQSAVSNQVSAISSQGSGGYHDLPSAD
ncbi:MAG: heavy metal-binding domain-containing protein, partial [Acidimicrobiia bacterium]